MTPYRTPDLAARASVLAERKTALAAEIQILEARLAAAMRLYHSRAHASVPASLATTGVPSLAEARALREGPSDDLQGFKRGLFLGALAVTVIALAFLIAA